MGHPYTVLPKHQADALLSQAAPVQNTWYTILAATPNVRVYGISVKVVTTGETLEVKMTIDGQTLTASFACLADTDYIYYLDLWATATSPILMSAARGILYPNGGWIEGRSVKVEVRKTTNAGAGTLIGKVVHGKY